MLICDYEKVFVRVPVGSKISVPLGMSSLRGGHDNSSRIGAWSVAKKLKLINNQGLNYHYYSTSL
jgi:hypothetical protein